MVRRLSSGKAVILSAFRVEIDKIAEALECKGELCEKGPLRYVTGRYASMDVLAGTTGVGKVRAAAGVQAAIELFDASFVLFVGTAGALSAGLRPLDLVVSDRLLQHDTGPDEPAWFDADPELSCLLEKAARSVLDTGKSSVHRGDMISGDYPVLDKETGKRLADRFGAVAVDMEAAAAASVSAINSIPFAAIKAVTDSADRNVIKEFKKHVHEAAAVAQAAVLCFLSG